MADRYDLTMRPMRHAALLAALVAAAAVTACTSSTSAGTSAVSTFVWGTPTLIAYRDGGGTWSTPPDDGAGTYTLNVTNDYQLVIVCSDMTGFTTKLRQRTIADGSSDFVWCVNHGDPEATVEVTGQMAQPGFVSMYDDASSTSPSWAFALQVPPGLHDLGATGNGKLALRRDVAITGAGALPAIDLDTEGVALIPTPLAVGGLGVNDQVTNELDIYTSNDIVTAPAVSGTTAEVVAPAQLTTDDQLDLFVVATDGNNVRTADTWVSSAGPPALALPPPLTTDISFAAPDTVHATWGALPPHDAVALQLAAGGAGWTQVMTVDASQTWLDATGATELAFALDPLPPRFQAAWTIDPRTGYTRSFAIETGADIIYTAAVRESVGAVSREAGRFVDDLARRVDRVARRARR